MPSLDMPGAGEAGVAVAGAGVPGEVASALGLDFGARVSDDSAGGDSDLGVDEDAVAEAAVAGGGAADGAFDGVPEEVLVAVNEAFGDSGCAVGTLRRQPVAPASTTLASATRAAVASTFVSQARTTHGRGLAGVDVGSRIGRVAASRLTWPHKLALAGGSFRSSAGDGGGRHACQAGIGIMDLS